MLVYVEFIESKEVIFLSRLKLIFGMALLQRVSRVMVLIMCFNVILYIREQVIILIVIV